MSRLTAKDLARIAWRATLLQATWNYERHQGLGWAWSLQPALDRFYPDPALRAARLAEHTAYFNTQPTLASVALGAVAGLEEQRAQGEPIDADAIARVKGVLGSALAAVGDRLFWFTLRPFVACLGIVFALAGTWHGAVVMWVAYNLVHLGMRWRGVHWGYERGPAVLGAGLRENLDALVTRLGVMGSALVGVATAMMLVPGGDPRTVTYQVLLMAGIVLGLMTTVRSRPTPAQWALGLGLLTVVAAWMR
jgi:PTS system mannose-specific IID component